MVRVRTIFAALTLTSIASADPPTDHAQQKTAPPPQQHAKASTAPNAKPHTKTNTVAHVAHPQTPPHYNDAVRGWHAPAKDRATPLDRSGRPMLALYALNTGDRVALTAASEAGGFSASDLDRATHVTREPSSGNEHPIEPRLLDVIYRIQTHFNAQEIRIISGYRTPHGGGSNHGRGRALDIIVPGTSDEDVAKFAREIGFVGVGIYPTSGFVHVDVRNRSYFWVDASGPGKKNRERGILAGLAQASDTQATLRGEHGIESDTIAFDVDAALRACAHPSAHANTDEDDDEDTDAH